MYLNYNKYNHLMLQSIVHRKNTVFHNTVLQLFHKLKKAVI